MLAFAYEDAYPESVGGAQRYYWALTRELARRRAVTHLTRKRWDGPDVVERDGVVVRGICAADADFRPALGRHLARHGGRYGVVHVGCFPSGAPLAARMALAAHRKTELIVDWHEVLPHERWIELYGRRGWAGSTFQRLAVGAGGVAITFSRLHERRLREEGRRGEIAVLPEFLPEGDPGADAWQGRRDPLVVAVGRLEREKHPELLPHVVARLRATDPAWRGVVFGDGPHRPAVEEAVRESGVGDAVRLAGFAPWPEVEEGLRRASALLFPSEREGFGLVVLEAAAHGLPAVLVAGPHNAATELIEPGRNGEVCASQDPDELAAAVLRAATPDAPARARAWFDDVATHFSVAGAAAAHEELYARLLSG